RRALEGRRGGPGGGRAAINTIAGDRMTGRGHVNPDLVGSPGLELHLEIAEVLESLENGKAGYGWLAAATGQNRHADTIMGMAAKRLVDDATAGGGPAVDYRAIPSRHGTCVQLGGE